MSSSTALCLLFLLCFSCPLSFLFFTVLMCLISESPIHGCPCFSHIFFDIFYLPYFIFYLLITTFTVFNFFWSPVFLLYSCHYLFPLISACFCILSISCPSFPSSLQEQGSQQTRAPRAHTRAISEHKLRISA